MNERELKLIEWELNSGAYFWIDEYLNKFEVQRIAQEAVLLCYAEKLELIE